MNQDPVPEDFMEPSEMHYMKEGPMAPIADAVYNKKPLLVSLRSNRKLYGFVKAVDRHWNMILEHVIELSSQTVKGNDNSVKVVTRNINRLFLRGDNIICVYPNPSNPLPEDKK